MKLIQLWYRDDYVDRDGSSDDDHVMGLFSSLEKLNEAIKENSYNFREPMTFKTIDDKFVHKANNPPGKYYRGDEHYHLSETEINKF